ncbi:hypothetical protein EDD86DRAFT_217941 [Gorgonomyces haynaldii]|nr:hypothetical protein EDD86DRAFT_217941 [Gorgonomyces haynaldii]
MFNSIFKKIGEAEQELSKVVSPHQPMPETLADEPIPASSTLEEQLTHLKATLEKYKNRLSDGAVKYNQLYSENQSMKTEISALRVIKTERDSLEKELNQTRLSNKLKMRELQKERDSTKSDQSVQLDELTKTVEQQKKRIQELQELNEKSQAGIEAYQEQIQRLQSEKDLPERPNGSLRQMVVESLLIVTSDTKQTESYPLDLSLLDDEQLGAKIKETITNLSQQDNKQDQSYIDMLQTKFLSQQQALQQEFQSQLDKKEAQAQTLQEQVQSLQIQLDLLRGEPQAVPKEELERHVSQVSLDFKNQLDLEINRSTEMSMELQKAQKEIQTLKTAQTDAFVLQEQIKDLTLKLSLAETSLKDTTQSKDEKIGSSTDNSRIPESKR